MSGLRLLAHSNYSGPEFRPENSEEKKKISRKNPIYLNMSTAQDIFHCLPDPRREKTLVCCVFSKVALVYVLTALLSVEARA